MSFLENTRKPAGFGGKVMVRMMNLGHRALSSWGLSFLPALKEGAVLDCGCGGGAAIRRLLQKYQTCKICGIDYSPVSVNTACAVNQAAIASGRCDIRQASVLDLPFETAHFDLVTAFETVYFWPQLLQSFREVRRVLKPGGTFLICNECSGEKKQDAVWTAKIDGMQIYPPAQLQDLLEQADFRDIRIHQTRAGWLCLLAQNP